MKGYLVEIVPEIAPEIESELSQVMLGVNWRVWKPYFMPEMDGMELIPLLRKTRPATKMIAISGKSGLMDCLDAAKKLGAHDTLKKPFSLQEVLNSVSAQLNEGHPRLNSVIPAHGAG